MLILQIVASGAGAFRHAGGGDAARAGLLGGSGKVRPGGHAHPHHLSLSPLRHPGDDRSRRVLNAHERFAAAAAAPVLLNVSIVAALAIAFLFPNAGYAAAWGVAVAGVLELLLVWVSAKRLGVAPRIEAPRLDPAMTHFFKILGPAVIGSAGVQLAMFADTIIASFLPTGAVASLYYADRIYQLPLGVIGIAAGTVLLPEMSRKIASGDVAGAHGAQNRAVGLTLALAAPFVVAFLTIPDLIMSALFQRGAFDAAAAQRSGAVLAAYAIGLPAAVLIRSAVASFYSRSDTVTPLIASLSAVAVNVGLKIVLTGPYGVVGLSLATAIGIWVNLGLLVFLALRQGLDVPKRHARPHGGRGRRGKPAACRLRLVRASTARGMDRLPSRLAQRDPAGGPRRHRGVDLWRRASRRPQGPRGEAVPPLSRPRS